jgi:hypothetical protein
MARRKKIKAYPEKAPAQTEQDLAGRVPVEEDLSETFEPTLPPSPSVFPPAELDGGIHDPVHVLKMAYFQMVIEKLQAQNTSYRISFDNQIKELQLRKAATLAQLQQELGTANAAYLAIQKEIEAVYGIQLRDYTFNPDNGMLNKIVDQSKKQDGGEPTTPAPAQ